MWDDDIDEDEEETADEEEESDDEDEELDEEDEEEDEGDEDEEDADEDEGDEDDEEDADEDEDVEEEVEEEVDEDGEDGDEAYDDQESEDISADDVEELDIADDVYDMSDYADVDADNFEDDDGSWTEQDYAESARDLFGKNQYFGETALAMLASQGFEVSPHNEELRKKFGSEVPGAEKTVNFFQKEGSTFPTGFLTMAALELLTVYLNSRGIPIDLTNLHVVDPAGRYQYDDNDRQRPVTTPSVLQNVDPSDKVDLRKYCTPIGDQGQTSRCKAFSVTHGVEMIRKMLNLDEVKLACSYTMMLFQKQQGDWRDYSYAYKSGGTEGGPEIIAPVLNNGICHESLWPNNSKTPVGSESKMEVSASVNRVPIRAEAINLDDVKKALTKGYPVEFGTATGERFMDMGRDGIYNEAEDPEGQHGYHSMLIVGYIGNYYIVKNSWGVEWGDQGYCYIGKNVLEQCATGFDVLIPVKE